MTKDQFLTKLAKVLLADDEPLADDQAIDPVTWDSIEILGTIDLIDMAGAEVKNSDILGCRTIGDLTKLAGF